MAVSTALKPARKESEMQALASVHMNNHRLTPREFFRSAYMWRFGKDIPPNSLDADIEAFQYTGKLQPYAVDYLINIYGAH